MRNRKVLMAVLLVLLASAEVAISAADASILNRGQLAAAEQSVDARMLKLWNDNTISLLGQSRASYFPGTGLVLSAEVTLATFPGGSLLGDAMTDKDKADLRKKKIDRLPQLRTVMKEVMVNLASSLNQIPPTEKIGFSVVIIRYNWEDPNGLPLQVTMQATKQELLAAKSAGSAGLDKAIRIVETN